jgi:cytochrome c5
VPRTLALVVCCASALLSACNAGILGDGPAGPLSGDTGFDPNRPGNFGDSGAGPDDFGGPDGSVGKSEGRGLPCAAADIVDTYCAGCHGGGGGRVPLRTREDLLAPFYPWVRSTVADMALARMESDANPMPPRGIEGPSDGEIEAFRSWIEAGAPHGNCGGEPDPDAGVEEVDPFDSPVTCSSGTTWTGGDEGSEFMHPGNACVSCHAASDGPPFQLAGTLYPTAHEPDDCNGGPAGAVVVITDAANKVFTLPANAAGNFFSFTNLTPPYTARVEYQGRVREMKTPQTSGDCNACHTEAGAFGAPGRVLVP